MAFFLSPLMAGLGALGTAGAAGLGGLAQGLGAGAGALGQGAQALGGAIPDLLAAGLTPNPQQVQLANTLGAFGAALDPQGFGGALYGPANQMNQNYLGRQSLAGQQPGAQDATTQAQTQAPPPAAAASPVQAPLGQTTGQAAQQAPAFANLPPRPGGQDFSSLYAPLAALGVTPPFGPFGQPLPPPPGPLVQPGQTTQQATTGTQAQTPPQGQVQQQAQGQGGGTQLQPPFLGLLRLQ